MIQIAGPRQTGRKDARWLAQTDDGALFWSLSIFDGLRFCKGQISAAIIAMTIAQTKKLPTTIP
ncbi:MAG: hypothetical protein K8Q97_04605 [Candidatus Andersenbacteria bacterium]|nr:hypothetical protein [Candidatus Andersenbacteria bacterium]